MAFFRSHIGFNSPFPLNNFPPTNTFPAQKSSSPKNKMNRQSTTLRLRSRFAVVLAAIASLTMLGQSAKAQSATWNVNADGSWVTGTNWTGSTAPGFVSSSTNTDTATFGNIVPAATTRTITVDANRNIFGINFNGNSGGYTLTGGNLLLTTGGTLQTSGTGSTHTDSVNSAITLGGDYTFATASTTAGRILSIGTTVTSAATSGTTTLTLDGIGTSSSNAITGVVSNGGSTNKVAITKSGTGTWTLSGANTFTGDVTSNNGILRGVNTAATNVLSAFGTGNTINLNSGTLQLRANGTGASQTIVASNNLTTGSTAVTIDLNNNTANAQSTISFTNLSLGTGQLNLKGGNQYNLRFSGTTTLTGNATINSTTSGLSLVGPVVGDFGITKRGAASSWLSTQVGNLVLSGSNTYTGVTSVLEGITVLNANAPSGSAGALGNATSDVLLGNTSGSVNAYLISNNFTVGRNVTIQSGNSGTAFLGNATNSGVNTYSGTITLGSAGLAGHNVTIVGGPNHSQTFSGVIQDSSTLVGAAGIVTFGDVTVANFLTGSFSPNPSNGGSIAILSGTNTYSGGTVIDTTGAVRIATANAFGTGNLSIVRGTIQGNGTSVLAGISGMTWDGDFGINGFSFGGQGVVNLGTSGISLTGNRTVTVSNNTSTIGGVISGSGRSLRLYGGNAAGQALALNGASTFDGGLTVAGALNFDLTAISGNAAALGTGQLNLTNSTHSKVSLSVNTTVESLTSGINASITSFTSGTSALTNGTYALTITGDGTGAAGTATVTSGTVTAVAITSLGTNYTSSPTISLAGSTATFTPQTFGASSINLNTGTARTLTLSGNNASSATYAGVISGTGGNLIKNGSGTQTLTGNNTYTGSTTVSLGTLIVNGTTASSAFTVGNGGKLGGSGTVGTLTIQSGGTLAPGNSPGIINTGAFSLNNGASLAMEFTGSTASPVAGTNYDQVNVAGTVTLGGALDLTLTSYIQVQNGVFFLIKNDSNDAVTGVFSNANFGTSTAFTLAGQQWQINYNADFATTTSANFTSSLGNDVALLAVPEPSTVALLGLGLGVGLWNLRRKRRA